MLIGSVYTSVRCASDELMWDGSYNSTTLRTKTNSLLSSPLSRMKHQRIKNSSLQNFLSINFKIKNIGGILRKTYLIRVMSWLKLTYSDYFLRVDSNLGEKRGHYQ